MKYSTLHRLLGRFVGACVLACGPACVSPRVSSTPVIPLASTPLLKTLQQERPGCLGMLQAFCENLYSPSHQGTLALSLPGTSFEIRKGLTENDFSQVYFVYAETQIRHRNRLPRDFKSILTQLGYFPKLRSYLSRKPRSVMRLEDRADVMRLAHEIEGLWNAAIDEAGLNRMEAQHPGYSRLREDMIPLELKQENRRIRSKLTSEIAKAVWSEHPQWNKVEAQFAEVKKAYLEVITSLPGIPNPVRLDWLERIAMTRLIVPGSDPEVDMQACSRTEENAYYFTSKNYLTVCAGDFNSEDVRHTIAHELGHALDFGRSQFLFESLSSLGQDLQALKFASCSKKPLSCAQWNSFKTKYERGLEGLAEIQVQLPKFQACLKGKLTHSPIPDDYLSRVARENAQSAVSSLAESNAFLRIISRKVPAPNGTPQDNPSYLNPCGYYLWDPKADFFDAEFSALLFFNAEYQCSGSPNGAERFRRAVDETLEMEKKLIEARIRTEGEFSPRTRLNADGYASSPNERFADALGGRVFAHLLAKENSVLKRRALYLANNAWLCQKPSLQQAMPLEAGIQRKYFVEPHSEKTQRQKELLPAAIREVLQCETDFEPSECGV